MRPVAVEFPGTILSSILLLPTIDVWLSIALFWLHFTHIICLLMHHIYWTYVPLVSVSYKKTWRFPPSLNKYSQIQGSDSYQLQAKLRCLGLEATHLGDCLELQCGTPRGLDRPASVKNMPAGTGWVHLGIFRRGRQPRTQELVSTTWQLLRDHKIRECYRGRVYPWGAYGLGLGFGVQLQGVAKE